MLENYTRVRLITDKYLPQSATRGDLGYIIETYPDGAYEVEFSDANGITFAQIAAQENELQEDEPAVLKTSSAFGNTSIEIVHLDLHQSQKNLTRSNKK